MAQRPRKTVEWRGDSREVAHAWPKAVRLKLGNELTRIELGANPVHGEALSDVGPGVQCVRIAEQRNAYRVIYVASIGARIYVLHAFHKKSKSGIATPKEEKDVARSRYRQLCTEVAAAHRPPRRRQ